MKEEQQEKPRYQALDFIKVALQDTTHRVLDATDQHKEKIANELVTTSSAAISDVTKNLPPRVKSSINYSSALLQQPAKQMVKSSIQESVTTAKGSADGVIDSSVNSSASLVKSSFGY